MMFYRMRKLFYILITVYTFDTYASDISDLTHGGLDDISNTINTLGNMKSGIDISNISNKDINDLLQNSQQIVAYVSKSPIIDAPTKEEVVRRYEMWQQYGQKNTSDPVDFDKDKDITFQLYTQKYPDKGKALVVDDNSTLSDMDPNIPTKILIHGVASTSEDMQTLKDAYIKTGNEYNIIIVDWRKGAFCVNFNDTARISEELGEVLSKFIDSLDGAGKVGYVHIIGQNIASHVAGIAGNRANKKIDRITGLDPVQVPEEYKNPSNMLGKSCAETVDVIHTSAEFIGCKESLGTVDFFPNGGKIIQRGCGPVPIGYICSHIRAYEYYVESITSKTGFEAFKCSDWDSFKKKECYKNEGAMMGEPLNASATGNFYLETKFHYPYALVHQVQKSSANHVYMDYWKLVTILFIVIFSVL